MYGRRSGFTLSKSWISHDGFYCCALFNLLYLTSSNVRGSIGDDRSLKLVAARPNMKLLVIGSSGATGKEIITRFVRALGWLWPSGP